MAKLSWMTSGLSAFQLLDEFTQNDAMLFPHLKDLIPNGLVNLIRAFAYERTGARFHHHCRWKLHTLENRIFSKFLH